MFNELISYFKGQRENDKECLITDVTFYPKRDIESISTAPESAGIRSVETLLRCLEIQFSAPSRIQLRAYRSQFSKEARDAIKASNLLAKTKPPQNKYTQMVLTEEFQAVALYNLPKSLADAVSNRPELPLIKAFMVMCQDMSMSPIPRELIFSGSHNASDGLYNFQSVVITCKAFDWSCVSLEQYASLYKIGESQKIIFSVSTNTATFEIKLVIYTDIEETDKVKKFASAQSTDARKKLWGAAN